MSFPTEIVPYPYNVSTCEVKPEDCHEFEAYSKFLVIMGYNIREFLNKINKIKQKMNQKFNSTTLNILKLLVTGFLSTLIYI